MIARPTVNKYCERRHKVFALLSFALIFRMCCACRSFASSLAQRWLYVTWCVLHGTVCSRVSQTHVISMDSIHLWRCFGIRHCPTMPSLILSQHERDVCFCNKSIKNRQRKETYNRFDARLRMACDGWCRWWWWCWWWLAICRPHRRDEFSDSERIVYNGNVATARTVVCDKGNTQLKKKIDRGMQNSSMQTPISVLCSRTSMFLLCPYSAFVTKSLYCIFISLANFFPVHS